MNASSPAIDIAAIFEASPNPYVLLDPGLRIVEMNAAYLAVTHRTREEIIGRNIFEAFPSAPGSESEQMLRASLQRVLDTGEADNLALIPYPIRLRDGTMGLRYWSATHTPLKGPDGKLRHILQHTVDVTELEELRAANEALARQREDGMRRRAAAVQAENVVLAAETQQLRTLFEQAPSFMAVLWGSDYVFALANAAYHRITGHRQILGLPLREALPEIEGQGLFEVLDRVRETGEPFIGRDFPVMLQTAPDAPLEERRLDFVYQPILGPMGSVLGIFVQGHDITDQKQAERALARQQELMRLAQEAGGVGTFEWDIESGLVMGSPTFRRLYGLDEVGGAVPAAHFATIVHPEDREQLAVAEDGQPIEDRLRTEYRVVTPGGIRWIGRQGEIVRDEEGRPVRVVGAAYDITERKESETQMRLLMQELAHRVKNMLAMVGAITTQTLRNASDIATAREAIDARLLALSRAQDALTAGKGASAPIHEVVEGAARLLGADDFSRFSIHGPDLLLPPKTALGLGLLLHELGTNAIKYGALSGRSGRVRIEWRLPDRETGKTRFSWEETGGPAVTPPERKGFGSRLIERGLVGYLGGPVSLDYAPHGVRCSVELALTQED
ncbi:PAS domain-containing protein [Arsenicitalea aurantiaca]|uniref:PAS domain-containing protein n=1 Tax=Arsenicitalea aurantiaca TaxID=1783274 RepID=UPI0013155E7A|nr:PAS domain-containing protein [Arsenicitalea aurantiaca]